MAPSLSISFGPSIENLSALDPNDDSVLHQINHSDFQGRISVRVKNFTGKGSKEGVEPNKSSPYFENKGGKWMTYSIQIQGRWLEDGGVDLDDLVFGNQFEKPIKDNLPYGTSIALRAASFIDPNLTHDLYCEKPWAFSPLLATMNKVNVERPSNLPSTSDLNFKSWPAFPSTENRDAPDYVEEDISPLFYSKSSDYKEIDESLGADIGEVHNLKGNAGTRGTVLGNQEIRKNVRLSDKEIVNADFANGFIDFNTLKIELPHSGGWGLDLRKYWDGQPVTYVCKNKTSDKVYFVVRFNIEDLDA